MICPGLAITVGRGGGGRVGGGEEKEREEGERESRGGEERERGGGEIKSERERAIGIEIGRKREGGRGRQTDRQSLVITCTTWSG